MKSSQPCCVKLVLARKLGKRYIRVGKKRVVNRVRQRVRLFLENDLFSSFLNIEKYILVFFHVSSFRDRSIFFFFEYREIYWPVLSLKKNTNLERNTRRKIVNHIFFHVSSFRDRSIFFFFEYREIYWLIYFHLEIDLFFFEYRDIYWPYLFSRFFI